MAPMRVAFGSEEHCVLSEAVLADLLELGQQVLVVADGEPWPVVTRAVAGMVASGEADRGVLCCRNTVAATAEAEAVAGVRVALGADAGAVREARGSVDANLLALPIDATTAAVARAVVAAFVGPE